MSSTVTTVEGSIAGALDTEFAGRGVRVTLTPRGRVIGGRLGAPWFVTALRTLDFIHLGAALEAVIVCSEVEPMSLAEGVTPAVSGGLVASGQIVGRISVAGHGPSVVRPLQVPSEAILDETAEYFFLPPRTLRSRLVGNVYRRVYSAMPMALDQWRQSRNSIHHRSSEPLVPPDVALHGAGGLVSAPVAQDRPVAWFALHWLEPGGAESWALESARLAAAAGFEVVIMTDVTGPQRLLEQVLGFADHVYTGSNIFTTDDWELFLPRLLEQHRPTFLHIHHSRFAYGALPELRHRLPELTVIDSTHIAEHRTGGFVRQSVLSSPHIDVHHVISPQLRDLYVLDAEIAPEKVVYHPLVSGEVIAPDAPHAPHPAGPLRIGFLGRLAPQKRPFLFAALVRRLHREYPGRFTFLMQGSGVLEDITARQIRRMGLDGVLDRRPWGPIDAFMDEIDVLVISSDNEGLTLTSLEAERHGVLVLSADVGSQRTVVAEPLLAPRGPRAFLSSAVRTLALLANSPEAFLRAQREQRHLVGELGRMENAATFYSRWLTKLTEEKN